MLSVSSERWNDTRKTLKVKQYYNVKKLSISSSYFSLKLKIPLGKILLLFLFLFFFFLEIQRL